MADPAAVPVGAATIGGIVVVLHPASGRALAVLDGASLTALRTAGGTELADVLCGRARVEAPPDGVIAYLSGGLPIQDALAATAILERARREGGGTTIAL